jgi:hypothetical protein
MYTVLKIIINKKTFIKGHWKLHTNSEGVCKASDKNSASSVQSIVVFICLSFLILLFFF